MDPHTQQQPNRFDPQVDPDQIDPPQPDVQADPAVVDAERQERLAYLQSLAPPKKSRKTGVRILIVLAIVAVIGGGVAAYYLLTPKDDMADTKQTTTKPVDTKPAVTKPVPATEAFDSTLFGFSIKHPKGWTPEEGDGKLTITSPSMELAGADGKEMAGQIVVTFAAMGQGLGAFSTGNGEAVLDSQKLTYTAPTSVQRAQTYLSFVQYPATTATGALDALYVTGDYGYLKGQAVPLVDLSKLDPVVSVTFLKCTDASCATAAAAPVAGSNWSDPVFSMPIQTTIESLAFND
jgi:hypothetical protein